MKRQNENIFWSKVWGTEVVQVRGKLARTRGVGGGGIPPVAETSRIIQANATLD